MLVFGLKGVKVDSDWEEYEDYEDYDWVWIYIEDALQEGAKNLRCPFCDVPLTAKKATKNKAAHFAHRRSACGATRQLRKYIHYLPIIDYWLYDLKPTELRLFNRLRRKRADMDEDKFISYHTHTSKVMLYGAEQALFGYKDLGTSKSDYVEKLLDRQLIKVYRHSFGVDIFELSWKSKMLWAKDWTLKQYYQEISRHWTHWLQRVYWQDFLLDNFFRAMNRRLEDTHFYLLKIELDDKILYKTGTTILPYEEVARWEKRQLKRHGKEISIEKIYYTDSISLVEPFIRLKYKRYRYSIGHQTGYFDFKNKFADFKKDLHQVTLLSKGHKEKIKKALKTASNVGKRGKETTPGFLSKPKSLKIIELLEDTENDFSLRSMARMVGCSVNTIQKVKQLWEQEQQNKPSPPQN